MSSPKAAETAAAPEAAAPAPAPAPAAASPKAQDGEKSPKPKPAGSPKAQGRGTGQTGGRGNQGRGAAVPRGEKAKLIEQVKSNQRTDSGWRRAWANYCLQHGGDVRDPTKHAVSWLKKALSVLGPIMSAPAQRYAMQRASPHCVEIVKQNQRTDPGWHNAWTNYCIINGGGVSDPAKHSDSWIARACRILGPPQVAYQWMDGLGSVQTVMVPISDTYIPQVQRRGLPRMDPSARFSRSRGGMPSYQQRSRGGKGMQFVARSRGGGGYVRGGLSSRGGGNSGFVRGGLRSRGGGGPIGAAGVPRSRGGGQTGGALGRPRSRGGYKVQ